MTDAPSLRMARLLLRDWREADRDPFAAMNADPEVMTFVPRPRERATAAARAALKFRFRKRGPDQIVAFTAVENPRSRAVMERIGIMITTMTRMMLLLLLRLPLALGVGPRPMPGVLAYPNIGPGLNSQSVGQSVGGTGRSPHQPLKP